MSNNATFLTPAGKSLLDAWMEKFSSVIGSMTDDQPSLNAAASGSDSLGDDALILEQYFASEPTPLLWIGLPEALQQELGRRVLSAAGMENSSEDENRATSLEMLEQSLASLAGVLTKRLGREINRKPATPAQFFPSGLTTSYVTISFGETAYPALWIAFAPLLISWLEAGPEPVSVDDDLPIISADLDTEELFTPPNSQTYDLLLDVALPVSVSFGRTQMPVKDVLKLTTGSIVELNRSVNEPVEVIVNGCIIARGEVVVVEGNYGVRVLKIISRKERLRTGVSL